MYSLKVILLLNCVRQGDLNSKRMSLNFFKVSQSLCSSLSCSILPSPVFSPFKSSMSVSFVDLEAVSFQDLCWETQNYWSVCCFDILPYWLFSWTFYMGFLSKKLINSVRSHVLRSWKKFCITICEDLKK